MFCTNCGTELSPASNFCPNCGCKSVSTGESQPKIQPTQPTICPKTYLTESILVTLFCCLPFGIAGIVQAGKVSTLHAAGRYQEAEAAGRQAKTYVNISFYSGLAFGLIYFIILLIAAANDIE